MAEITDQEGLRVWLEDKPREVCVAIAARAALRVLPLYAEYVATISEHRGANLTVAMFRAVAVARLAGTWPSRTTEVRAAADAGSSAAAAAYSAVTAYSFAAAATTTSAASAAASASASASAAAMATIAAASAAAAAYSFAVDTTATVWRQVDHDVRALDDGTAPERLMRSPLWIGGTPDGAASAWTKLKNTLLSLDRDWQVWTEWYEDILSGAAAARRDRFIEALELRRVLIPDEDWKQGPAHVNALIAAMEEEYRPPLDPDELPAEDPHAGQFRETEHKIDADALAGHDKVATDPIAQDLHAEALRYAQALLDTAGQILPGANTPNDLLADSTRLIESMGETVNRARPGLLIPRAAALQTALDADDMRQADPDLEGPPLSAAQRAALVNANNACRIWINTDPFLGAMDAARLGLVAHPLDTRKVEIVVSVAVEEDAATQAAQDLVMEAQAAGPASRYGTGTALNFLRRGLKIAVNSYKVLRHPVRTTARAGLDVARWLVRHEEKILDLLEDYPDLRDTTKRVIESLKKLPFDLD